ncbi:hypothetical protein E3N88_04202 [Mikania micrantha]|uniref:Uncharacterized protein n=1 Tax=Mikania micrantha TaxID=192012 RepID=A0A5N6PTQ8_9ASTR|nr:hypothetical protein E3N88_04202 [Mikania micrantha]
MAFHVACPITCRRICNCDLGFPPELRSETGRNEFLEAAARVEAIFTNPGLIYGKPKTVQVLVPKVVVMPPATKTTVAPSIVATNVAAVVDGDRATVASASADDYACRFESGEMTVVS